jgi:adenosylcobyric acid synthase
MSLVFLLGGARSGKSAMAQRLAAASGLPVTVVATAEARDADMAERIRRHQQGRPAEWSTIEAPLDVASAVRSVQHGRFVIVDCLTLWVSNLLEAGRGGADVEDAARSLLAELATRRAVVVSNEVGLGIVPDNELSRTFRDALGAANTVFAARAERTVLMVAGRGLDLAGVDAVMDLPPD